MAEKFEVLEFRGKNGHGWKVYKLDGMWQMLMPGVDVEKQAAKHRQLIHKQMRDDDVLINAYPKCGTHWFWELTNMILAEKVEYRKQPKEMAMLGMPQADRSDEMESPRVLNAHVILQKLPKQVLEKKLKVVNVMRNPKDVVVSYFNHLSKMNPPMGFDGDFDEFLDLFLDGRILLMSYFDFIKDWLKVQQEHPDLPLINLYYEDMKKEPEVQTRRLAEFLGKDISQDLCQKISEACSFNKLKQASKEKIEALPGKPMWKDGKSDMYRKGEIGDWKNWLTVAQNERFDDVIRREMEGSGITFKYE